MKISVDKNIAALCSTKKTNGTTYIFYYTPDKVIAFLTGADVSSYSEQKVKVKDASGNKNTVTGSDSPLATTTWNDEVSGHGSVSLANKPFHLNVLFTAFENA